MKKIAKSELVHYGFLIVLSVVLWKVIHLSPAISQDVYPYLNSISPELVKGCLQEKQALKSVAYENLLAIRSTIPEDDAQVLIDQLRTNVPFSGLAWGQTPKDTIKAVRRHRDILKENPYYYPGRYQFPVRGESWFEDSYGADREGGKRRHEGTDLFGKEGTPIISCCSGVIEQLGWNRLGGERVGVRGDDGNYYYYAHLQFISPHLALGNRIQAGEAIGGMGHTGDALTTPDHLHFGIELPDGQWTNPYPFLAVWQLWEEVKESQPPR